MKKIMWSLVMLMFASLSTPVYAEDNNPNSFERDMNYGDEIMHMAKPVITSSAGHTDDGRYR